MIKIGDKYNKLTVIKRVDFNILLELNGLQHYEPVDWFGGEDGFEVQKFHDLLKHQYACDNGFTLIEICTNRISEVKLLNELHKYNI